MLGEIFDKFLIALGVRKTPLRESAASNDDDFVARHGLSYGEAADPISKEARFEAERQKSFFRNRR